MPGARWFPGATLNFAEHLLGSDDDLDANAVVSRSQTRGGVDLTFRELRDQVALARAGLQRLGVRPGDRVVAYMPNIPETLVAFAATASLGAIWASCAPELGARSVIDRLAQLEPTVLLAVGGLRLPRQVDRPARGGRDDPRCVAELAARRARALRRACDRRTRSRGRPLSPSPARSSSLPSHSTIRCSCSSHPGRPAVPRRSCTGTAGFCSS